MTPMRAKLMEWGRRYVPLEIAATVFALAGGFAAATLTANGAVIAYAATWAENVGFYGLALWREIRGRLAGTQLSFASGMQALSASSKSLALEFGPAELFDSFVLRPAAMYFLPQMTGDLALGLVLGKVLADAAFYGLSILSYEWAKRRR